MAKVENKPVITTRGKNYVVGDDIIMKLKNGKLLVGIILRIWFEQLGWYVDLQTNHGVVEVPLDYIED